MKSINYLNSLKDQVDKVDIDNVVSVSVDFSKLMQVVKNCKLLKRLHVMNQFKNINTIRTNYTSNLVKKND